MTSFNFALFALSAVGFIALFATLWSLTTILTNWGE